MIVLWITLLLLHRGSALIPVTTAQLGESITFTCLLPNTETIRREIHWYKQTIGDTLKIIWMLRESESPQFAPEFSPSRWKVNYDKKFNNLTILRTNQEDEGIYHCGITEWRQDTKWTGTYLIVKGNTQTSNYTVVQEKTVRPGEPVTLQCSLHADSDNKTCPEGHQVFWIREGTQTSHPGVIYTGGNMLHKCEKRSETQQRCVFRFSKNISSSDAGTYRCAVATCGEILFAHGTEQQKEQPAGSEFIALLVTAACLVISVILNVFFCWRTPRVACEQFKKNSSSQAKQGDLNQRVHDSTEDGNELNYAALHFSGRKTTRGKKKNELETEESVYSQVKCKL